MQRVSGKHLGLVAGGLTLIAFAASLTTIVDVGIKADVRASVVVDTSKAWARKHTGIRRPVNVHAWNVTNLKDVLDGGTKPQLGKVDIALTYVEEGSDLKWLDGGDAYEFSRWSTYVPRDAVVDARLDNTEVVGLNPAYLSIIAEYGSEGAMLRNLSSVAVKKVADVLDAFISKRRLAAVPTYLNGVAADLLATGLALDGTEVWSSIEKVARQWAGGAVLGGPLSVGYDEKYTTFEASDVSEETALALWDASHQYSLLTEDGSSVWTAALSGDGAAETALSAVVPGSRAVLTWLSALVDENNLYYLAAVAPTLTDKTATTWRNLRGQQFATGAITQKLHGVASVLSLQIDGVVVAPELPVYAAAMGTPISLTAAEANTFLDTNSYTPLSSAAAGVYETYLNEYLPRDFLLNGFVVGTPRADGTGTKNGGLFTRRTLREIIYGHDDPLLDLLDESPYSGALDVSSAVWRFGLRTGKRHLSDVGKYTLWRGSTKPLDIWRDPVSPIGLAAAQAKPFDAKSSITVWSDELLRPVTFRAGAATTVKDVEARNYALDEPFLPMPTGMSLTRPALGGMNASYRAQFEGLPAYVEAEHDTWCAIEPLTGKFIKSHTRLEHSWSLDAAKLNLQERVFARLEKFTWPQLYIDEADEISGKDAKVFIAMVYGARDQAVIWAVIVGFLGIGLVIVGLHGLLVKDDKATQVWPTPPREQRRPQHDAPKVDVEPPIFVEELKEDPADVEEPVAQQPPRKTMTLTILTYLPTPYNFRAMRARH